MKRNRKVRTGNWCLKFPVGCATVTPGVSFVYGPGSRGRGEGLMTIRIVSCHCWDNSFTIEVQHHPSPRLNINALMKEKVM